MGKTFLDLVGSGFIRRYIDHSTGVKPYDPWVITNKSGEEMLDADKRYEHAGKIFEKAADVFIRELDNRKFREGQQDIIKKLRAVAKDNE